MKKILHMWNQLNPADKKLIRLTSIVCLFLLIATLTILSIIVAMSPSQSMAQSPKSAPTHSETTAATQQDSHNVPPTSPTSPAPSTQSASYTPGPDSTTNLPAPLQELKPLDIAAHQQVIQYYSNQRQYEKILPHIERVSPKFKDDLKFQSQAGQAYLKSGLPEKAATHLNTALQLQPDNPQIAADLGMALFRSGHTQAAIDGLRKQQIKHPTNPFILTTLASILGELDPDNSESDSLFSQIITTNPTHTEAHYQYSRKLMNQGNFGMAKNQLAKALALEPLDNRIHARLGMSYFYLQQDKLAEKHYRTALALHQRDYNTWYNLGELYLSYSHVSHNSQTIQTNNRRSLTCFLNTIAIEPMHAEANYKVGLLLNNNKQFKEAIHHLQTAHSQNPRHIPTLLQLAIAWEAIGNKAESHNFLTIAHEIDPFNRVITAKLRGI
jgi:Flp pilus assembly protein TadD